MVGGLKGQCHEIYDFRFCTWISFSRAPDNTIRAVSNFFKNLRRYSQLKVHHQCRSHRWQMEKIFNQIGFHYFFWTPLDSRVSIKINFSFKFIFSSLILFPLFAAGVVDIGGNWPQASLTPVANLQIFDKNLK
jgi:hypothetical protein